MTLKQLAAERKLRMDALGLLAGVDKGTISRIANGKVTAKPETVVKLATALGISARRMQSMCDASWAAAHAAADEAIPA
jgi:transcriptional regulator with XRE-family HTH domain